MCHLFYIKEETDSSCSVCKFVLNWVLGDVSSRSAAAWQAENGVTEQQSLFSLQWNWKHDALKENRKLFPNGPNELTISQQDGHLVLEMLKRTFWSIAFGTRGWAQTDSSLFQMSGTMWPLRALITGQIPVDRGWVWFQWQDGVRETGYRGRKTEGTPGMG